MTAEELQALLPEWQKRLRLQDWTIRLAVHDDKGQGSIARMANQTNYHAAVIDLVLDPSSDFPINTDLEVTLVHELLHVQGGHLTEWLKKKKRRRYYDEMERLVEFAAIALVELKRRGLRNSDVDG